MYYILCGRGQGAPENNKQKEKDMSIFGPKSKIAEPAELGYSAWYKNFIKFYDKLRALQIKTKDDSFDLYNLLFIPWADVKSDNPKYIKYYLKQSAKALLQLIETATAYDHNGKDVLIDMDVMQNVVEPLGWAQLNPDTQLAGQIFWVAKHLPYDAPFDIKFFNALSDEEVKLGYVRRYNSAFYNNADIRNDLRKLVFNPKCMDFGAIGELFDAHKFKLSKEEFEILWPKYKSYLIDMIQQYSENDIEVDENGVKHVPFSPRVMGLLCGYIKHFVPGFDKEVHDGKYTVCESDNHYDSWWMSNYISMQFIDKFDAAICEMKAAQEKDAVKKLQLEKDGLDKQFDAEIQAIKDFVAERKVKIQNIKSKKQEIEGKLKAIEEENKRQEAERAKAELQKEQDEFEAMAAKLGVNPADLLALQQKSQQR